MAYLEFIGCLLTAYGPALALLSMTVDYSPVKIILMVISAFFWLLAVILSSIIYALFPYPNYIMIHIVICVILQEGFRQVTFKFVDHLENMLHSIFGFHGSLVPDHLEIGYVSGFGFGIISGLFSYANILTDLLGPGTVGLNGGHKYFSLISAIITACFILLHTFWSIIYFDSVRTNRRFGMRYVIITHLYVSCITLFHNTDFHYLPIVTIIPVTIFTVLYGYKIVSGRFSVVQGFVRDNFRQFCCNENGSVMVN